MKISKFHPLKLIYHHHGKSFALFYVVVVVIKGICWSSYCWGRRQSVVIFVHSGGRIFWYRWVLTYILFLSVWWSSDCSAEKFVIQGHHEAGKDTFENLSTAMIIAVVAGNWVVWYGTEFYRCPHHKTVKGCKSSTRSKWLYMESYGIWNVFCTYVTRSAIINRVSAQLVIFLLISSALNVASCFCKFQKKALKFCSSDGDFILLVQVVYKLWWSRDIKLVIFALTWLIFTGSVTYFIELYITFYVFM